MVDEANDGKAGGDGGLEVFILKAKAPDMSELDAAYDGIRSAAVELFNRDRIQGYAVRKYKTDKVIDCDDLYGSGKTWLDNHGFNSRGSYLWVTNCGLGGGRPGVASSPANGDAWNNRRRQAFVAADDNQIENNFRLSVLAIQEAFHPLIAQGCEFVCRKFGSDADEHELGQAHFESGRQRHTPMTMTYAYYANNGNCDNGNNDPDGVTRGLSICTEDAMKSSWRHANGYHSHDSNCPHYSD